MTLPRELFDIARDGVAGKMGKEPGDERFPSFFSDIEMRGSFNGIELMEIVGEDSSVDKRFEKLFQRLKIVVDSFEKNGLVKKQNALAAQL